MTSLSTPFHPNKKSPITDQTYGTEEVLHIVVLIVAWRLEEICVCLVYLTGAFDSFVALEYVSCCEGKHGKKKGRLAHFAAPQIQQLLAVKSRHNRVIQFRDHRAGISPGSTNESARAL